MATRSLDPLRLDVERFARAAGHLEGEWPLASLPRLVSVLAEPPHDGVTWQADGEHRAVGGGDDEIWLHLQAAAVVSLTCQRCLAPLDVPLQIDRSIRFARDESVAEALDAELEEDVLASTRALDLRALVEDELLLGLPLVPRHERCPDSAAATDVAAAGVAPTNPFAVLAALKKDRDGG